MKILLAAASYPHSAHAFSGIFSERNAEALRDLGEDVTVLAPRPFVPPIIGSLTERWRSYASIPSRETRNGIRVVRPAYLQLPKVTGALCFELGGYLFGRRSTMALHRQTGFDAILAFDLAAGGLAWRLGEHLGIPATGWAFGNDIRVAAASLGGRAVQRTLQRLDVVFYQSRELMERAAELLQLPPDRMPRDRHVILPHGIPHPPDLRRYDTRKKIRAEWEIPDDRLVVLSIGRITRDKGVYEVLEAIARAAARNPRVKGVVVGSMPGYDESAAVQALLGRAPDLGRHVKLVEACGPDRVWEYLCAADLFVLASHREGMPNSLLEAMAMGVPAVAFSIPPVLDIDAGMGALLTVPVLDIGALSEAIVRLAASPEERVSLGRRGQTRVMDGFMVAKNMRKVVRRIARVLERRRSGQKDIPGCLSSHEGPCAGSAQNG